MKLKKLQLSQDQIALVDDEDYDKISHLKWTAIKKSTGWYARAYIKNELGGRETVYLHHFVLQIRRQQVDHIDHNGLNNQKNNLRLATHSQNQQNRIKKEGTSSRFKGVSWNGKKWFVQIKVEGRSFYIGTYNDETEAANAYDNAAKKIFGEFAKVNFDKNG